MFKPLDRNDDRLSVRTSYNLFDDDEFIFYRSVVLCVSIVYFGLFLEIQDNMNHDDKISLIGKVFIDIGFLLAGKIM